MKIASTRICRILFFFMFLLAFTFGLSLNAFAADRDIVLLYTNDVHCGIDKNVGYAKLVGYRSKLRDRTPYVLTVDAGDSVQGGPFREALLWIYSLQYHGSEDRPISVSRL